MDSAIYVHIISHTHWDREWYLNSKYTNEWLVPFFDGLFRMMEKEPDYRFVLDGQTSMIEDCIEQLELQGRDTAEFRKKLEKFGRQGRLVVGPYYLQPDWQLISEEACVRNLMIGMRTASEFGGPMKEGWLLDNFGQISQAPQIHRQFGLKGLFLWRGLEMEPSELKSEFLWESPDGTVMPCVYFLSSYRNAMRLAEYKDIMKGRIKNEVRKILPFATTPNVLLMNGYDQEMIPDDIIPNIRDGGMDFDGFKVVQSTPDDYMEAVIRSAPSLRKLKGALYSGRYISVFPGILSSRMYLKIQNDLCQKGLEKYAEPLQTLVWCLGGEYGQALLAKAWKLLLKNHPHDSICGVGIDDVHTDMEKRFAESCGISSRLAAEAVDALASCADTGRFEEAGSCYMVMNTLTTPRGGVITINDGLEAGCVPVDGAGKPLPFQKGANGRTSIYADHIPALGYTTIYAVPANRAENAISPVPEQYMVTVHENARTAENRFIKAEINADGTLNVTDKANNVVYPGIAVFEDGADSGDEYNYSYPENDTVITSAGQEAEITFAEKGPLRAVIKIKTIMRLPECILEDYTGRSGKKCEMPIVTWITIDGNNPAIRFRTEVYNTVRDHRFRVLFRTGINCGTSHAEAQFDVVERKIEPDGPRNSKIPDDVRRIFNGARESKPITTFPQRTFVDLSDGKTGAAVLNRGLPEFEILKDGSVIALTLFRSVGWVTRDDLQTRIGDAGPQIAVPDAQCLRMMEFDYAFYPHAGTWAEGGVVRHAEQFGTDLIIAKSGIHKGILPDTLEFIRLEDSTGVLKVTAVKRSEDGSGIIVRLHNPSRNAVKGELKLSPGIAKAYYVNLNEEITGGVEQFTANSIKIEVKAGQIMTLKIEAPKTETRTGRLTAGGGRGAARIVRGPFAISAGDTESKEDFSAYKAMEAVTLQQVKAEEERAERLEDLYSRKESELKESMRQEDGNAGGEAPKKKLYEIRLQVETLRRASLEARLSALLIKKKYLENGGNKDALTRKELEDIEASVRSIGYKLNEARVSKRVLEYIADFYSMPA